MASEKLDSQELDSSPISDISSTEVIDLVTPSDNQEKLHEKLLGYYKEQLDLTREERNECRVDLDFYEDRQWTSEELKQFKQQKRIPVTINEVKPTIQVITGMEARNRMEIKILPRNDNDVDAANSRTALVKYVADQNDLEFRVARAFESACTYGFGVLETGYAERPNKECIIVKNVNPEEFFYDPYSKMEPDLEDAEYCGIAKKVSLTVLENAFPQFAATLASEVNEVETEMKRPTSHHKRSGDQFKDFYEIDTTVSSKPSRKLVKVIQMYYKVRVPTLVMIDEFGDELILEEVDEKIIAEKLQSGGLQVTKKVVTRIRQAIFTHNTLLYEGPSPYKHGQFPFVIIWSGRYSNGAPVSPIRTLRDAQREVNRRRSSSILELIANQWLLRGVTNENLDKLKKELGDPFALVKEPVGTRLEKLDRANNSPAHFNYYKEARDTIRSLSGANDELRGLGSQYQSGYAIGLKQQQGTTVIAALFDNLRRARKQLGYQLLSLIDQYMSPAKKQRIVEKSNINYDMRAENKLMFFDVACDEQPLIATDRQSQLMSLAQVMSSLPPEVVSQLLPAWLSLYDLPQMPDMVEAAKRVAGAMVSNLEIQAAQGKMQLAQMQQQLNAPVNGAPGTEINIRSNQPMPAQPQQQLPPPQPQPQPNPLDPIRQMLAQSGRPDLAELPDDYLMQLVQGGLQ